MGIIYGLTAAFCWGVADFVITSVARRIGVIQAFFYLQFIGLLTAAGLLAALPGTPTSTPRVWALTVGISVVNLAGTLLLYRAFAIGTLAIVAPITSGFAVVTALLALLTGERPAPPALVGALLLIVGVGFAARHQAHEEPAGGHPARPSWAGLPEAIGVAFCFGINFWALDFVTPSLGIVWPVLITRAVQLAGALLLLFGRGLAPARLPRPTWVLVVSAAVLDTLAFMAFNLGASSEYTAIVTALASLFSAVTVLLAWALLRDRLSPLQWAGVGVILTGVLLVSLPDTLWAWAYGI